MANIPLDIKTKGHIPWSIKREITTTLGDCYQRFNYDALSKIEVHILDKESTMRNFLKDEKFRLGITTGEDDQFICSYDVWRGYPRITICAAELAKFNKQARQGAVRHEAAHTILHGSLGHNIYKLPEDCRQTAMIKSIDLSVLQQALYYLSVAIKDFEATRFLIKHDYIDCQFAFALERIRNSEEVKPAWESAKTNRQTKFIYQTSLMKSVLFAHPLLSLPRSKKISLENQVYLGRMVEELVEHLGEPEQNKLLQVANMIVDGLTEDTHKNVDFALRQSMSLA